MAPAHIDDLALHRAFDSGTLARGRVYASSGRVREVDDATVHGAGEVYGSVAGSAALPYQVVITLGPGRIQSWCTCPVQRECKHAVAVLWRLRSLVSMVPVPAVPAWRRTLEGVLSDLENAPTPSDRAVPLGLRFELPPPRRRQWRAGSEAHLWMRLVRRGARDNWIKTGVSWRQLDRPEAEVSHDPAQVAVLRRIARAAGSSPADTIPLARVAPGFLGLLEEAREAGVALVGGERISSVTTTEDAPEVLLDVTATPDGSEVRLGVALDGDLLSGDEVHLLGARPHTVGLVRPVRVGTTAAHPKVSLLLAPLAVTVPPALAELHRRDGTIAVPRADREAFEETFLPRLREHLRVSSSDASLDGGDSTPARLQVLVEWAGVDVTLTWQWRFEDGTADAFDSPRVAVLSRRAGEVRDTHRAVAVFAHLLPRRHLSGLDTRTFAEDELWQLRAHDAVEVLESGTAPEFRDATGDPSIEFVADEADDGTTDWLDLQVVISLDGEQVPITQVLQALTVGEDLVLPSGLVVGTDRPEFRRLADLLAAAAEIRSGGQVRVGKSDLGTWHDLAELGVVDPRAERWVEAARALVGHESLPAVDPVGVSSTLREYQLTGVRWLVHLFQLGLGGILADDMGLGKTLQTLALVSHARAAGSEPFLVVAPTSVMSAWSAEAARHTPGLRVCVIDATRARRGTDLAEAVAGADLVVTSYTLFRLESSAYAALRWGGLVLDEAQALKNHQSRTYRAVRSLDVPFSLAVTGTPFENRLMELWSLLSVVAPGLYPSAQQFADQVVRPVEKQGDPAALDRFRSRVRPFVLRRTKELVAADLPPKQEQVMEVVLGAKHQRLYDTWFQRERQSILGLVDDFDANRVAIFSALTRLRQLSLDPALVDTEHEEVGSAKLDVLVDHLVELAAEGHRALVFSQFTGFLRRARARLEAEGVTCRYLDGSTRRRGEEIEAFRSGDGDAFLISLKAGGVGLTLTEADYVFVLDPWWNPAAEAQAVDRAHRIGQQRSVNVYRMVSVGTIEEKVMALKERKAALFASVFAGEGAVGTGIDAEDVRALFD